MLSSNNKNWNSLGENIHFRLLTFSLTHAAWQLFPLSILKNHNCLFAKCDNFIFATTMIRIRWWLSCLQYLDAAWKVAARRKPEISISSPISWSWLCWWSWLSSSSWLSWFKYLKDADKEDSTRVADRPPVDHHKQRFQPGEVFGHLEIRWSPFKWGSHQPWSAATTGAGASLRVSILLGRRQFAPACQRQGSDGDKVFEMMIWRDH